MKYAYKTEIKPTNEQALKIKRSIGICRWLYNEYLATNKKLYMMYQRGLLDDSQSYFMTAIDFDKYINRKLKLQPEYNWLSKCGSKARKKILLNGEVAFRSFFKGKANFPKFKAKFDEDVTLYFPKNNPKDWTIERYRIKIPTLKYVRLKEFGYLPVGVKVINGIVSMKAGRFYISITVEAETQYQEKYIDNIGLKLNFRDFSTIDKQLIDINNVNKILKSLERVKQRLKRKNQMNTNKYISKNAQKELIKIKKLEARLENIKFDYINKCIAQIINFQPKIITIKYGYFKSNMTDNHQNELNKERYYRFITRLTTKADKLGIQIKYRENFKEFNNPILELELI